MLAEPLPGDERKPTPMQTEDEGAGFLELMGKAGTGGVARGASR